MLEIFGSVALGGLGALALWGLYRALELNWPEQYVSLNDTFALRVTQTWWRFLLYRFVPVFSAGVAVWATTSRLELYPAVAILAMTVLHLLHTNVIAAIQSFGRLQGQRKFTVNYASYHLLMIVIISAAALSSALCGPRLQFLVPKPDVLLENLWIAVFVGIAGGVAVSLIGKRPEGASAFDPHYFVWRAKRDVGLDLTDYAFEMAIDYRCDPILLRAIMFAEALQRPRWVRFLEQAKGRVVKRGSYGVTQEWSEQPIPDREAIRRTAEKLSGCWGVAQSAYGFESSDGLIWKHAAVHNEDVPFIQGVQEIYRSLEYGEHNMAYQFSIDGLRILEVRRYPHRFGLRAITSASSLTFTYTPATGSPTRTSLERPIGAALDELWAFELTFDVDVSLLEAEIDGAGLVDIPISAATA